MSELEVARLLLAKARQDEYVLSQFVTDADAADEMFGFHAQQAAEKLLKAALLAAGIVCPRTHRLGDLLDLGHDNGLPLPEEFEELNQLTPFAVEYRYEFYAEEVDRPLDRQAVLDQVRKLRAWVEARVAAGESSRKAC
jgi:HEPN domain-containing protein